MRAGESGADGYRTEGPHGAAESEAALYHDLYDNSPCGYLSTSLDGSIIRVNQTLLAWTGCDRAALLASRFIDLLAPASQLFYETRGWPVLRLEGEVREVVLTLRRSDGSPLP